MPIKIKNSYFMALFGNYFCLRKQNDPTTLNIKVLIVVSYGHI